MLEAFLMFLGGSTFRAIWGEVAAFVTKRQDHQQELALMAMQQRTDAQRHSQQVEMIRIEAERQVQVIRVQGDADVARIESDAWLDAVRATSRPSGVRWVDGWNGAIRPGLATLAGTLIVGDFVSGGYVLSDAGWAIVSAALGVFLADRALRYQGKA